MNKVEGNLESQMSQQMVGFPFDGSLGDKQNKTDRTISFLLWSFDYAPCLQFMLFYITIDYLKDP